MWVAPLHDSAVQDALKASYIGFKVGGPILDAASAIPNPGGPSDSLTACQTGFVLATAVDAGLMRFAKDACCGRLIKQELDAGRDR
jgi:hypothetical protein